MSPLALLAACVLSGQVPAEDVPRLCAETPGLADLIDTGREP